MIDENKPDYGRGDYLMRGLLGADEETGAIAVGERVRVGQTLRFHVRDAASADEDLRESLAEALAGTAARQERSSSPATAAGAACSVEDHDARLVEEALGRRRSRRVLLRRRDRPGRRADLPARLHGHARGLRGELSAGSNLGARGHIAAVPRLRRVDCSGPGIARRGRGRGFEYLDENGNRIEDPGVLERIRELVIPPAWQDVWICPYPHGHIQAIGTDAAGRRQYRYHDRWRERRDAEKFDEMLEFARALPRLRKAATKHLALEGLPRERVLAGAVRLLDTGFFRIGGEDYAEANSTYGLATMRKHHVTLGAEGVVSFDYESKGGQQRIQSIVDTDVYELVGDLKRRRSVGDELLAYKEGRRYVDVKSPEINAYIKEHAGGDFSAKDFRTWNATMLAAVGLAVSGPGGRDADGEEARDHEGDQGSRALPREHAGRVPRVLHRPAGLRPLPRRPHNRRRHRRARRRGRPGRPNGTGPRRGGSPRPPGRAREPPGPREGRLTPAPDPSGAWHRFASVEAAAARAGCA